MPIIKDDPMYIPDKDKFFMGLAKHLATGSSHPLSPGGCVVIRDRDVIGTGRSLLAACKVEVDCVAYAVASACKSGTPMNGAVIYSTRYPFSASIFQMYLLGVRKIFVAAHDWEPYYKDEFRRAARLARELVISIEPMFDDEDERFTTNTQAPRFDNQEQQFADKDLYTTNPVESDSFEIENYTDTNDDQITAI